MDNLFRMIRSGNLKDVSFPSVLFSLYRGLDRGELKVKNKDKEISIFIENGFVVHATSTDFKDRIEGLLLEKGRISEEIFSETERTKNKSLIRILMEKEAVYPRELKDLFRTQTLNCVYQIFDWHEGEFSFSDEGIRSVPFPLSLSIVDILIEGIRAMKNDFIMSKRFSSSDIFIIKKDEKKYSFEPHEMHVLSLIDGKRNLAQICKDSELTEKETIRVLYLLSSLDLIEKKIVEKPIAPPERLASILDTYNQCFSFVYRNLYKEIGPIAENILEKYISDVKENLPEIFKSVSLKKDGSLNLDQVISKAEICVEDFVHRLDEFLIAMIYAVKKTLGQKYESYIVKVINEIKK